MNNHFYESLIKTMKVLVIDDEPNMRKVTKTILAAIGITKVVGAGDGRTGLETARSYRPDLIIVDWEMPTMDGPHFVQMIRSPEEDMLRDTPIIMLSAHSEMSRVVESVRIGANEFVRKPVSIKTLHDRIIAVVSKKRLNVQVGEYYGPTPRKLSRLQTAL